MHALAWQEIPPRSLPARRSPSRRGARSWGGLGSPARRVRGGCVAARAPTRRGGGAPPPPRPPDLVIWAGWLHNYHLELHLAACGQRDAQVHHLGRRWGCGGGSWGQRGAAQGGGRHAASRGARGAGRASARARCAAGRGGAAQAQSPKRARQAGAPRRRWRPARRAGQPVTSTEPCASPAACMASAGRRRARARGGRPPPLSAAARACACARLAAFLGGPPRTFAGLASARPAPRILGLGLGLGTHRGVPRRAPAAARRVPRASAEDRNTCDTAKEI